jgi:hypothetical protein
MLLLAKLARRVPPPFGRRRTLILGGQKCKRMHAGAVGATTTIAVGRAANWPPTAVVAPIGAMYGAVIPRGTALLPRKAGHDVVAWPTVGAALRAVATPAMRSWRIVDVGLGAS